MSKKKKNSKNTSDNPENKILHFLENLGTPSSLRQIAKKLKISGRKDKMELARFINDLVKAGKLREVDNKRFISADADNFIVGKVDHVNRKYAYIVSDEREEDVYVRTEDLKYAFDGDLVKVSIYKHAKGRRRAEGAVTEILERSKEEFVGRVEMSENFAFVIPDNRKLYLDFFVNQDGLNGAQQNQKVLVKVKKWPGSNRNPEAEVTKILGMAGENEAEIHSIIAEFGFKAEFPEKVEKAADDISTEIPDKEIKKRRDFRDTLTFTVDPEDAKDFDDALSIKFLSNGNTEVGIHIADVTHYVTPGKIIDKEAIHRATSVYLVDRTIPMLPEKLSNGLCSLNPNQDKLTFSAVFELDKDAIVQKRWFGRTVIHSDRRYSYEEAQESLETKEGEHADEMVVLNKLAHQLRKHRFKNGAINFETVEVKFKLDDNGKPLAVIPKVRKDAHKLIEEFMLLANREVATFVHNQHEGRNTFVYRTHDDPDPEKLNTFSVFARKFGYQLNTQDNVAKSLNNLMKEIEGKEEQNVLEQIAIRSMAKAKYTTKPDPHFGLAFAHYTHFTSPIRRYPDMMVHRLLQHYLDKGKPTDEDTYEDLCEHCSEMEKRAADAERASIKYKQVEFMQLSEDKPYAGIISGVTEWGIYVEIIETKCEGMIRLSELDDDYYEYDEDNFRIIGRNNKKMYTLGDKVTVRVVGTDIDRRTIDLSFADGKDN